MCVKEMERNGLWERVAQHPQYNLEEIWIYAFCQDAFTICGKPRYCCYVLDPYVPTRRWKRIRDLPRCILQRQGMSFEVVGQKAYLIGGRDVTISEFFDDDSDDDITQNIVDEVYCYDATTNSWSKAASLSTPRSDVGLLSRRDMIYLSHIHRCHFASEVLDGRIYAVGSESTPGGRDTWEVYDPITNIWTSQSDPHVVGRSTESMVYNGKLYVRNFMYASSDACGAVYDPSTGTWHDADNDLVVGWHRTCVVADGRLYAFGCFKLTTWEEDKKEWTCVAELSSFLMQQRGLVIDYCVAAVGKMIFVIGKGLFTVALDVSNVGKKGGGGELWISDVAEPILEVRRPLICKCMAI